MVDDIIKCTSNDVVVTQQNATFGKLQKLSDFPKKLESATGKISIGRFRAQFRFQRKKK